MVNKIENKDLCTKCGGKCCKGCGCVYVAEDFDNLKLEYLEQILATGHVSIAAHLEFSYSVNGKPFASPTLFLRERNMSRDIVDLVSISSQCVSLTENGCSHDIDHRPTGGRAFIPNYPNICESAIAKEEMLATCNHIKMFCED